jgi:outer membrane protein assembly factor BamB
VTGKSAAISITVKVVGNSLRPSETPVGHTETIGSRDNDTGVTPMETVTAYNPATAELVWQVEHPTRSNIGSAGNLATGGDLVFQGSDTGDFYALDARTGKRLLTYPAKRGIRASPITYQVAGRQYVTVVATSTVLTFGLP